MDTVFLNSRNSKKSDPHRLLLNLSDKTNLKRSDKYVALSNLSIYYAQKKHKKSSKKKKKKKTSAPTWNGKFKLPKGSHSVSNTQEYFEYILKDTGKILIILQ